MQAGAATSQLQRGPNHLAKEGLGTLGGRGRAAHELGRVRKPGTGDRKLEKDAGEEQRAVFMVVEKAARLVRARLPRSGGR